MKKVILVLALALLLCGCGEKTDYAVSLVVTEESPAPTEELAPVLADISGQLYGYWHIYDAQGEWAEFKDNRWDCCARLYDSTLFVWDEDIPKEYGLGELVLAQNAVVSGRFLDSESGFEDWIVDMNRDEYGACLIISGRYTAVYGGEFSFEMQLRPWGSQWPDTDRPENYERYMGFLETGEEMPDEFW